MRVCGLLFSLSLNYIIITTKISTYNNNIHSGGVNLVQSKSEGEEHRRRDAFYTPHRLPTTLKIDIGRDVVVIVAVVVKLVVDVVVGTPDTYIHILK